MPAAYQMSWQSSARRWWKMVDGKRYVVSVRQLRQHFNNKAIEETKESSYQWANKWMQEKIEANNQHPTHPLIEIDGVVVDHPNNGIFVDYLIIQEYEKRGLPLPREFVESIIGKDRLEELHRGLHRLLHPVKTPQERTVGGLVDRYLETVYKRKEAGEISISAFANARTGLVYFRDRIGPSTAIESVDPTCWQSYYDHLISPDGPVSIVTRRKFFRYARNFLTWVDDLGIHPAPKNLNRKQYRFKGGSQAVPSTSKEAIITTINNARGQLQLHVLLMVNCGFTQQDIADLHPSEVDWQGGRIRRKRSKTGDLDKVPMVDYLLWDLTYTLLQKYRSTDPMHVLLTASGRAWVRDSIDDKHGKRTRSDSIQAIYRKLPFGKPAMKMFRKAGSSALNDSPHGRFATHYLGHAPTIAHKHYISQNGPAFDDAIRWLGKHYGFATTR